MKVVVLNSSLYGGRNTHTHAQRTKSTWRVEQRCQSLFGAPWREMRAARLCWFGNNCAHNFSEKEKGGGGKKREWKWMSRARLTCSPPTRAAVAGDAFWKAAARFNQTGSPVLPAAEPGHRTGRERLHGFVLLGLFPPSRVSSYHTRYVPSLPLTPTGSALGDFPIRAKLNVHKAERDPCVHQH